MTTTLKLTALFTCALALCANALYAQEASDASEAQSLQILFIGNSFTFYNDLDQTVSDMLNVSGVAARAQRSTPGGWRLRQHYNGELPKVAEGKTQKFTPTPEVIKKAPWDYVVLQEQSSGAVDHRAEFLEYGAKLAETIRENNAQTQILLYQTWARCDGMFEGYGEDSARRDEILAAWTKRYSEPDEATVEALKDGMQGGYAKLAQQIDATISPVGLAFSLVGDTLDLYCDEGDKKPFHPNPNGTYLAGCVFYKVITGKSPQGMFQRLTDAGKVYKVEEKDASYLEKIAEQAVDATQKKN